MWALSVSMVFNVIVNTNLKQLFNYSCRTVLDVQPFNSARTIKQCPYYQTVPVLSNSPHLDVQPFNSARTIKQSPLRYATI